MKLNNILICYNCDKQKAVINAIKEAVENSVISEGNINEKVYRILKLKQKYHVIDKSLDAVSIDQINNRINGIYK